MRAVRAAVIALSVALLAFFVNAVAQRLRYPVELEWMGGGVLDAVERVQRGEPVYVEPSAAWVPYMYPPLYYWVAAAVARAAPLVLACRVVSIVATGVAAALVARISRALGAAPFWTVAAVGCFFACYALTGYWYDIERADTLCVAMILGGLAIAIEARAIPFAVLAGAVLGLAFFAKQPALLVCAGTCAGLLASGRWRHAIAVACGAAGVMLPLAAWLHATTHGWWDFYCLAMGAKHGIEPKLFTVFFVIDLSRAFALTAATFAVLGWLARDLVTRARARAWTAEDPRLVVFACALAAAFVSSAGSRLHVGGFVNVLVFWSSLACVAVAVVGTRVEAAARDAGGAPFVGPMVEGGLALGVLLQLANLAYDPAEPCPTAQRVVDASIVEAKVRELEKRGEVLLTGRGHVTVPRHFHAAAMMDVMRGGYGIPEDLVRGLRERRYAAYVVDEWGELTLEAIVGHRSELFDLVVANYYVAERLDDREPPPVVGWIAHPSWILKPRARPLAGMSFEELDAHRRVEMGFAELRMREAQAGAMPRDEASVEDLAQAVFDAARVTGAPSSRAP